jgi:tetratricopeptide (TPR) repeat protein
MSEPSLTAWKIVGIIATILIILSIPLYRWTDQPDTDDRVDIRPSSEPLFVGSDKCRSCHKPEYDKWRQSHHRWAMARATEETVRGDFSDAEFQYFGVTSKFFRKNDKYYVATLGPEGVKGDFEITHTFGWYPLQQYLVPFPGGRLQCLPIAWDVEKQQWYHLYPDRPLDPDDWLYWTNQAQNWNGMCAECHSTDLKKNYDPAADAYKTSWSEINVGCEACHGPGSAHVRWAKMPEMGRPSIINDALTVQTRGLSSRQQIELCAPCHSRRMSLDDNIHRHADFLDYGIPQLLSDNMYYADGQILEEVYVYGSFMQSKMYARDVRCSDCHDMHGTRRIKEGNALCLQCHKAAVYDTKDHHFHKQAGEKGEPIKSKRGQILFDVGTGALCEQCHMPGRIYMGIDYRPDHSFRIPRPDLSRELETPNACNRCHIHKTTQWSVDALAKWYGQKKRPHYGTTLAAGRKRQPEALPDLIRLSGDRLYPTIVRATALTLLASYNGKESRDAFLRAMTDEESLMRHTAVRHYVEPDANQRFRPLTPLLYDPVRAVRIEAARLLAAVPEDTMETDVRRQFETALSEYRQAMDRTADFAASRHNLGNLCVELGDMDCAIRHYQKTVDIDQEFYPAKVNLAMLYNRQGKNEAAEKLLREVAADHPEQYGVSYSLGLLLAERKKFESAAIYLRRAARGMPQNSRVHYNLGLLLQQLKRDPEAEASLLKAHEKDRINFDYLYALTDFYVKRYKFEKAKYYAKQIVAQHPDQQLGHDLLRLINGNLQQ